MTIDNLSIRSRIALARKIKLLIEPKGASSPEIISEVKIRKLIKTQTKALSINSKNCTSFLIIDGLNDIIRILASNYSNTTINRLMSKIKPSVVWDASITNLSTEKLSELFYNSERINIFTSLTINELTNLSNIKIDAQNYNHDDDLKKKKAKFLLDAILKDTNSDYSLVVNIEKHTYVDTQILEFCSKHKYPLYTFDRAMALRAKCYKIDVTFFNNINTSTIYTPNENGKNIILSTSLLKIRSATDIVDVANKINGGKFIITCNFVEELEAQKSNNSVTAFICFLLSDKESKYTIYLSKKEYDSNIESIDNLAERIDAMIFTASVEQCFLFKSAYFSNYTFIDVFNKPISDDILLNNDLTQNNSDFCSIDTDTDKYITPVFKNNNLLYYIPHFNVQRSSISLKKIELNEKMWVLDENEKIVPSDKLNSIPVKNGDKVIYCKNTFNNKFFIIVCKVVTFKNSLYGKIIFSKSFKSSEIEQVGKYKHYAEIASLMT